YLEQQNRARQTIEKKILDEAIAQATELKCDADDCRGIVLGAPGWHPGVIGIVASRIVERFNRPAVMIALSDDIGQGSGRSISGFHLARALEACHDHLEAHGGHEMAAGLKLHPSKFADFRAAFCEYASQTLSAEILVPQLYLDTLADLQQVTHGLVNEL